MAGWMEERKEDRLMKAVTSNEIVSDRLYNGILGGVVVYGIAMNAMLCAILGDRMLYVNPIILIVGYVVCCIAGILLSSKSDNAVISFIGYNLVAVPLGLVLSITIYAYGGLQSQVVVQAFIITALITGFMIAFSIAKPEWFESIGGLLFGCLGGLVIAELVMLILGINQLITSWIGAALFSFYIGYDFYKAQQYPKTVDNAVDSALDIYLDVINLFIRILRILGSRGGSSSRSRR